jgi:hypothetical protein
VIDVCEGKGLGLIKRHLGAERHKMEVEEWHIIAAAACGADDTYFALVKFTYHLEALHGEHTPYTGYKIFEFDVLLDDTKKLITSVHERSQLSPEDVGTLATVDTAQAMCSLAPFPEKSLKVYPKGLSDDKVKAAAEAWCKARCSGNPEAPLADILDPSFRLHDAYGILPVLCDPRRRFSGDESPCTVPYDQVQDIIAQTKTRYDVECRMIDCAVSSTHNLAFTHWHSNITNKADGAKFGVEGIEVDLFGPDGRIIDIWLFRDPMDFERAMLLGQPLQGGAAKGAGVMVIG